MASNQSNQNAFDWERVEGPAQRDDSPLERVGTRAEAGMFKIHIQSATQPGSPANRALAFFVLVAAGLLTFSAVTSTLSLAVKVPRWVSATAGLTSSAAVVVGGVLYIRGGGRRSNRVVDVREPTGSVGRHRTSS